MQEIHSKEETFGISSSSTSEEDHEDRQESRHVMNMTPNDPRTEESTCKSSGTQLENGEAWIFIAPWTRATRKFIRYPPPQDREQEADWIAKGGLVSFIYFGGFYTMISATMSNIMGQSPCLS
jgi:hypothetical protein